MTEINLADDPQSKPPRNYGLRSKAPTPDHSFEEKRKAFLRQILPPNKENQTATPGKSSPTSAQVNPKARSSSGSLNASAEPLTHLDPGYNIIKDMKKTRANISLYELTRVANQRDIILKTFANPPTSKPMSTTSAQAAASPQSIVNAVNVNSRGSTSHFLLSFEIFNFNVHNCLVDSGASTNVMPLFVCNKLNIRPKKTSVGIIQLDRS